MMTCKSFGNQLICLPAVSHIFDLLSTIKIIVMNKRITTVDNEEGDCLSVVGDTYRILISGEQTGGSYAVIDMLIPPGGGPGSHSHDEIQEMFYVVDGEIEFKMEGKKHTAAKGSFVNIPFGGGVHYFKNTTDTIAHLLCTVVPAGLDSFFKEIGKPVMIGTFLPLPTLSAEELNKLKAVAEKYGQKLYPDFF